MNKYEEKQEFIFIKLVALKQKFKLQYLVHMY